jgi:hypothetical protein
LCFIGLFADCGLWVIGTDQLLQTVDLSSLLFELFLLLVYALLLIGDAFLLRSLPAAPGWP